MTKPKTPAVFGKRMKPHRRLVGWELKIDVVELDLLERSDGKFVACVCDWTGSPRRNLQASARDIERKLTQLRKRLEKLEVGA